MKESKDFYNILFDKDEHTCFSRDTYGNTSYEVSEGLFDKSQFFTINPLIKGRTRAGSNVKRYRNLLFELYKNKEN